MEVGPGGQGGAGDLVPRRRFETFPMGGEVSEAFLRRGQPADYRAQRQAMNQAETLVPGGTKFERIDILPPGRHGQNSTVAVKRAVIGSNGWTW